MRLQVKPWKNWRASSLPKSSGRSSNGLLLVGVLVVAGLVTWLATFGLLCLAGMMGH